MSADDLHHRLRAAAVLALAWALGPVGCVIGERGGVAGSSAGPTATVPDTGSFARRESAAETLNEAAPEPPAEGSLEVGPAPNRTPPPPVQ